MSWNPVLDPDVPVGDAVDAVETVIVPRARDLGSFEVRRALPAPKRQMVGPFIFFDQMGPAEFVTGQGIDIRPHPHIGLATVTYLFKGNFHHRDSLGTDQWIEPGAVNLMTAGHGITHSERVDGDMLTQPYNLFGIQTWIALPKGAEDAPADFVHAPKQDLPVLEGEGKDVRLILGSAYGAQAPAQTASEMFYADAQLAPGARLPMPDNHEDRGAYVVQGNVEIAGQRYETGQMMVFRPGDRVSMTAGPQSARYALGRGNSRRAALYLVEFRRLVQGADRRGQAGMAPRRLGAWPLSASADRQ